MTTDDAVRQGEVAIANPCPRDWCGGSIMADGTCFLCTRSVGEPVAEPIPLRMSVREEFPDWSAKCNMREHTDCGGQRLARSAPAGSRIVPCACPCHRGAKPGKLN